MSTRTTLAFVEKDELLLHLYYEMHDDATHLDIVARSSDEKVVGGVKKVVWRDTNSGINVIVPERIVESLKKLLAEHEDD